MVYGSANGVGTGCSRRLRSRNANRPTCWNDEPGQGMTEEVGGGVVRYGERRGEDGVAACHDGSQVVGGGAELRRRDKAMRSDSDGV